MWEEAVTVLQQPIEKQLTPASHYPMLHYLLAYYLEQSGRPEDAATHFETAAKLRSDYAFPFRLEMVDALESAIRVRPEDARTHYYLGNLLFDLQPERAISSWQRSAELDPSFAPTQRNLGWAFDHQRNDIKQAIQHYEAAIASDPGDPRLFSELDLLREKGNVAPEQRLDLLDEHREIVMSRNYSFLRYIRANVLVGNYDEAIDHLANNFFHVSEGGGEIHNVFVDAHLLRGIELLKQGKNAEALQDFLRAAEYPENLSVGVPRQDPRNAQVAFLTGRAHAAVGNNDTALQYYRKAAKNQDMGQPDAKYYRGLALDALGEADQSEGLFKQLISEGSSRLANTTEVDFFAKFGEQQSEQESKALGYYEVGLGHLGRGHTGEAKSALEASNKLNVSNVWAVYQLGQLR